MVGCAALPLSGRYDPDPARNARVEPPAGGAAAAAVVATRKLEIDVTDTIVSLCANVPGVRFMCGTCKFFDDGYCQNPHKKLNGRPVERLWCCNEYKHTGMRVIVK